MEEEMRRQQAEMARKLKEQQELLEAERERGLRELED